MIKGTPKTRKKKQWWKDKSQDDVDDAENPGVRAPQAVRVRPSVRTLQSCLKLAEVSDACYSPAPCLDITDSEAEEPHTPRGTQLMTTCSQFLIRINVIVVIILSYQQTSFRVFYLLEIVYLLRFRDAFWSLFRLLSDYYVKLLKIKIKAHIEV